MKLIKRYKYKVNIYHRQFGEDIKIKSVYLHDAPCINDFRNEFAPKLSNCFAIHFYRVENGHWKQYQMWFKTKRGWKMYE